MPERALGVRTRSGLTRSDVGWAAGLALAVTLVWCIAYGRTSAAAWATPITYRGDSLFLAAYLKAARDGHVVPGRASSSRSSMRPSGPTGMITPARCG